MESFQNPHWQDCRRPKPSVCCGFPPSGCGVLFIYFSWLHDSPGGEMKCDLGETVAPSSAVGAMEIFSLCTASPQSMVRLYKFVILKGILSPQFFPLCLPDDHEAVISHNWKEELISALTESLKRFVESLYQGEKISLSSCSICWIYIVYVYTCRCVYLPWAYWLPWDGCPCQYRFQTLFKCWQSDCSWPLRMVFKRWMFVVVYVV